MKSFSFTGEQIARIIGAAAADELSVRFNRHIDFLTAASWVWGKPLGRDGMALNEEERRACARRAASLFGLPDDFLNNAPAGGLDDWARAIESGISEKLTHLSFKPATRKKDDALSHNADLIFQDAAAAANILYGRRRLLSFVAPHSLLGLELSVLAPNLLSLDAVDARGMTPDALSKNLLFGDVLIATPTLWRYMMQEKLTAPDNTMAVTFGEPMSRELAAEMRNSGFGVLREFYGSTETGLIAWRDSPGEPFALFDHWRREGDNLMRIRPDSSTLNVEPMDGLDWKNDRSFMLSGRKDGAIQIGAVNVFPDAIAEAMQGHEHIDSCEIVVGRRSDGASRLVAHIVLKNSTLPNEKTARAIDGWCRANLRQQERPHIYNFEIKRAARSAASD
ncbi:hypothetical protein [Hyphococcus sp.]|uniref:hypothetical protein n=1 Tax=Hyphococcus sp. TaxID=2038636 RepID=UPI003CCC2AFD